MLGETVATSCTGVSPTFFNNDSGETVTPSTRTGSGGTSVVPLLPDDPELDDVVDDPELDEVVLLSLEALESLSEVALDALDAETGADVLLDKESPEDFKDDSELSSADDVLLGFFFGALVQPLIAKANRVTKSPIEFLFIL